MRNNSRSLLSRVLAITAVAMALGSGACAHRRQIYDSSDFARRPIVRQRPALSKTPAAARLANEPKLARVVDERDDQSVPMRDQRDDDRP